MYRFTTGMILCVFAGSLMAADISGKWNISVTTPAGDDNARMELRAADGSVTGSYTGFLGSNKAVTGTYKNTKVALKFKGDWPDGTEIEVQMSGEMTDDNGSGEVVCVNKTDGTWKAKRVQEKQKSEPSAVGDHSAEIALERFVGDWKLKEESSQIVEKAVREATESMNALTRGVARGRLTKTNVAPQQIRFRLDGQVLVIAFEGMPPVSLPLSGAAVEKDSRRISLEVQAGPPVLLKHTAESPEGKRENTYRISDVSGGLVMDVVVTSPRLPQAVRYTLNFTRNESSAAVARAN